MKVLIIGGSRFVGPLVLEKLLAKGHKVTVFNRGNIETEYEKDVAFVRGDRDEGFKDVRRRFDVVIDTCAYRGEQTERALRELNFDYFLHFSTAAVYQKSEIFPLTEQAPLGPWPVWGGYNQGKIEGEKFLEKSGVSYSSIRPVYILGPKNYVDRERFIYSKIKRGQGLILPGNGQALVQFVFSNEVAKTIVLLVEKRQEGAFNIAGDEVITLKGLVEIMAEIAGKEAKIEYNPGADAENFNENQFPFANENFILSNEKIKKLGISFAPLLERLKQDYETYYKKAIA